MGKTKINQKVTVAGCWFTTLFLLCGCGGNRNSTTEEVGDALQVEEEESQEVEVAENCKVCDGRGWLTEICSTCNGMGQLYETKTWKRTRTCSRCAGTGIAPCSNCENSGYLTCPTCGGQGAYQCYACNGAGATIDNRELGALDRIKPCRVCSQTGYVTCRSCKGERRLTCPKCKGRRHVECPVCDGTGGPDEVDLEKTSMGACPNCDGTGAIRIRCEECDGEGWILLE